MKPQKTDLHDLLDEILPAPGAPVGPTRVQVLGMVQQRRRARRRRFRAGMISALLLFFGLAAGALRIWPHSSPWGLPLVAHDAPEVKVKPGIVVVKEIDDEHFLALFGDTPVAVMEWPNGDRTLLVVQSRATATP
jgi:hypothetical protein